VLQSALDQPHANRLQRVSARRREPSVLTDERSVLAAGLRTHRIVKDRPRCYVQERGERRDRLRRRDRQVLRDEPQPAQRAQLQRDPKLAGRAVLPAYERKILAVEIEIAGKIPLLDRLRKSLQPRDLGFGEKPGRHRGSQ
jgi:hypothetical protein